MNKQGFKTQTLIKYFRNAEKIPEMFHTIKKKKKKTKISENIFVFPEINFVPRLLFSAHLLLYPILTLLALLICTSRCSGEAEKQTDSRLQHSLLSP